MSWDKEKNTRIRHLLTFLFFTGYIILLYFFYRQYVPLLKPFQLILIPVIFFVSITSIIDSKKGLYLFVFFFPLINTLPYFFGISESIPHAPVALVLFLFFFLGWAVHAVFVRKDSFRLDSGLYKPMILFACLVVISAGITFFRYTNFFPFLSDAFYELKTSVIGVTAGGAVMSTVFFSLSYLTSFAFLFIILKTVEDKKQLLKLGYVLSLSALISFCVGIIQYFGNKNLGINPRIISRGYVNATFKDSLSLGGFIAIVFALFLGMFFYEKKIKKVLFLILMGLSFLVLLLTGSKSGFLCVLAAVFLFMLLAWGRGVKITEGGLLTLKNMVVFLLIGIFVLFVFYFVTQLDPKNKQVKKLSTLKRLGISERKGILTSLITSRDHLWKSGLLMMVDYPLTGVGTGAYIIELANYAERHDIKIKTPESAENYFIQAGAELGIIGLIFLVWIYWVIFKRIKLEYSSVRKGNRLDFITIGIICAVVSYIINIQAHTYIGSYEVKYTFWLVVGLLFCLNKVRGWEEEDENQEKTSEKEKEDLLKVKQGEKVVFGKKYKILGSAFLILFGGVHLWNSTHSLSLEARSREFGIKQEFGFYDWEETPSERKFRWTKRASGKTVSVEKPVISIPLHASHPDIRERSVKVKVFIVKDFFREKILLDEIVLNESLWKTYEYEVPAQIGEEVLLLFKVSRVWNPRRMSGAPDIRNLGAAVGKITFKDNI